MILNIDRENIVQTKYVCTKRKDEKGDLLRDGRDGEGHTTLSQMMENLAGRGRVGTSKCKGRLYYYNTEVDQYW